MSAIGHNCYCTFAEGVPDVKCGLHIALVSDQRWLNGMLYARRIRRRLIREENRRWQL